jgi:anti-sigma-K factor RskA
MSSDSTENQLLELLPLYALGVLDADEMQDVERQLRDKPALHARLHELEELLAQLAHAAPTAPLPADAQARLMTRVRASLPPQPLPSHSAAQASQVPTAAQPASRRGAQRWSLLRRRVAAVGALAAVVVLALYVGQIQRQLSTLRSELAQVRAATEELRAQVRGSQEQLALLAGAEQTLQLAGLAEPGASGLFYRTGNQGVLVVSNLPPLAPTQTYQLWLVKNGVPLSVGLLDVQPDQPTAVTVAVPPEAADFVAFDVSVEPAGGSPTLLGPVVLQWKAPQPST